MMRKSLMIVLALIMLVSGNVWAQSVPAATGFQFPLEDYDINNACLDWGDYNEAFSGYHVADDECSPDGTDVFAVTRGIVRFARSHGTCPTNWGPIVVMESTVGTDTICVIYGHVVNDATIQEGAVVNKGVKIGTIADGTGCWADHIHFSIYEGEYGVPNGEYPGWMHGYLPSGTWPGDYVNPVQFILAGQFSDGWHDDGSSQAIWGKYRASENTGNPLGDPWQNTEYGSIYVHELNGMLIQDFNNPDNGFTMPWASLIYYADPWMSREAHLLKEGFWGTWMSSDRPGWVNFGVPITDEYPNSGRTWQTFRKPGSNYASNPNDYKQFYFRWEESTQVLDILDQYYNPVNFAQCIVEDGPSTTAMLEADENNYSAEDVDKLRGEMNSNKFGGNSSLSTGSPFKGFELYTANVTSLSDGVYHSGIKVANLGEPFELVDGDSYQDFYGIVNGAVVLIDSFTMNGNIVIYIDDSPPVEGIQFGYWSVYPEPGTVDQQIDIEGDIYNSGSTSITLSEIRIEFIAPNGYEYHHWSTYNITLTPGEGCGIGLYCPPYMPGNWTARFRGLINGQWTTFSTRTVYVQGIPLVAGFTADTRLGDVPLTVQFTDQTTGTPTSWTWDFGDGNSSNSRNPSHTYTMPGTYTVRLEANDAYSSDVETKYNYITVNDVLYANFTTDVTAGTAPLSVQFTDQSAGSPTSWLWNFGDGSTSTDQNPTHVYVVAGIFNVSLTVSDQSGSNTMTQNGCLVIEELQADFVANTTSIGAGELVRFTDLSTGNPTSWTWDFGDGFVITTDDGARNHQYMNPGVYTVTLTVSNDSGSDVETKTDYITVGEPVLSFTVDVVSGRVPLTVNFVGSAPGNPAQWCWDFGDGTITGITEGTMCDQYQTHVYQEPGVYGVELAIVYDDMESIYVIEDSLITVEGSFVASVTEGISPLSVTFVDQSGVSATSWAWDFGDGGTSTSQHTLHTYNNPGLYTVTFVAGNGPDAVTMIREDYIHTADSVMGFEADVIYGSAPLTVQFTNLSLGDPMLWGWYFGDGDESIDEHPTHTYLNAGVYSVTLISFDAQIDTLIYEDYITVVDEVLASGFTSDIGSGVAPLTVQFTDQSTGSPTSWLWNFGDGNTSTVQSPSHTYESIGAYTVSLTVGSEGASDSSSQDDFVVVYPAVNARFTSDVTQGLVALEVQFTDQSLGSPTSWLWNFGDGNTSTDQNPMHIYSSVGTYDVSLTANNAVDSHSVVKSEYISVSILSADYISDVISGILPLAVQFTDQSAGSPTSWLWNFGDGNTSTDQNPMHTYFDLGTYDVSLTVNSSAGSNSLNQEDYITVVDGLYADFSTNVSSGVTPLLVQFYDRSLGDPTSWLWNFGDGNTSADQSPFYTYTVSGTYDVSLLVIAGTDSSSVLTEGCVVVSDTLSTNFTADNTTGTIPLTVQFTDQSPGNPTSWLWNFGDGNTSTEQSPVHIYTSVGVYTVSLLVSDDAGANSLVREDYITAVTAVVADFTADPTNVYTANPIQFTDQSTGDPTSWAWDFGNGDTSTEQNPIHTYFVHGTYTVSLTVGDGISSDTLVLTDYITSSKPPVDDDIYPHSTPNPFNPITVIKLKVNKPGHVSLRIFDVQGRLVDTLIDQSLGLGVHQATFDGTRFSSGTYFYMIRSAEGTEVRKIMLVK